MKSLRIIIFLVLCFCPSFLLAREASDIVGDKFEETAGRGLVIRTNPSGVRVYINGVDRGLSPITLENLGGGEHSVRLYREGYKERHFTVTLFNSSRLVVSIEMEELRGLALVSVNKAEGSPASLPFNPQISTSALDEIRQDIVLSRDNRTLLNLPVGYHTIKARAFGWEDAAVTVLVNEHFTAPAEIYMKPAAFKIENGSQSRKRFNPANPNNLGSTEYRFEVSAPGTGTITVFDSNNSAVYSRQFDQFDSYIQFETWNGMDNYGNPVPEGLYTVLIEASSSTAAAGQAEKIQIKMETEIDYSINIFPLTLAGGIPGMTFTPLPDTLPKGSYQIEAGVFYGKFRMPGSTDKNIDDNEEESTDNGIFSGFPFIIGVRAAPFNRLETSAVFNINPKIGGTGWGVTGSVKYNIKIDALPFSTAAGIFYAWASENGENPISPGRGIGLFSPLSVELRMFTFVFSPWVFWHGPEGLVPSLLFSAGVLYNGSWINAGLSMRSEFDLKENSGSPRFLAGVEGRFYPAPSNLVFSLNAGMWTQNSFTGGYGGIGIGIIY